MGGHYFGAHLTEKRGTMDGSKNDAKFFTCPDGFGVMITAKRINPSQDCDKEKLSTYFAAYQKTIDAANKKEEEAQLQIEEMASQRKFILETFKKIDTDGSMSIETAEFVKKFTEEGSTEGDAKALFTAIDKSGNGSISYAETLMWMKGIANSKDKKG